MALGPWLGFWPHVKLGCMRDGFPTSSTVTSVQGFMRRIVIVTFLGAFSLLQVIFIVENTEKSRREIKITSKRTAVFVRLFVRLFETGLHSAV